MKKILTPAKCCVFALISFLSVTVVLAQAAADRRSSYEAGLLLNLSRVEGDGPAYLRQNASDVSTNFGTKAQYTRNWSSGFGVYAAHEIRLLDFLAIRLESQVTRYATKEAYKVDYDPTLPSGLAGRSATVRNDYYNFCPTVAVKGKWKGFGLSVGLMANIMAYGHTSITHESTLADGSRDKTEESARLDTQGQPIYQDPSQVGGVVDYTNINLRNHGASPIWWSGVARASWKILAGV